MAGCPARPDPGLLRAGPTGSDCIGRRQRRDRRSGDRAEQDAAYVGRSRQVRPPRHRSAVAPDNGRVADAGRGPVAYVRGDQGTWTRAREQVRADLMRCRRRLSNLLAFIDNLAACDGLLAHRDALDERLARVAREHEFWQLVSRLRAFRGLDTLSAADSRARGLRLQSLLARGGARLLAGGWCPRASKPANQTRTGRSPRPAPSTPGGSSSKLPGTSADRPGSAARSSTATTMVDSGGRTKDPQTNSSTTRASVSARRPPARPAGARDHRR